MIVNLITDNNNIIVARKDLKLKMISFKQIEIIDLD